MPVYAWSTTAATNSTADSTINWAEGQAPSSVNDSARGMMAALAKYNLDIGGTITTTGTTAAYAITTNSVFDSLAHLGNQVIAFVPNATNTLSGGQTTLAVDGLTAKPIRFAPGIEMVEGSLILGTPYVAIYNASDACFYLRNFGFGNPYLIPVGGILPYAGTTAPNTSFALAFGQAINRTTFGTLFTLTSTTYGVGNGSTTFNVPDLRGRVPFGKDNMGGSTASNLTSAGFIGSPTTLGATGGAQIHQITAAETPSLAVKYNQIAVGGGSATTVTQNIDSSGAVTSNSAVNATSPNNSIPTVPPGIILNYILRIL